MMVQIPTGFVLIQRVESLKRRMFSYSIKEIR